MVSSQKDGAGPVGIAFIVLAVPLVVGAFYSADWTWGWDHLHRIGPIGAAALILVGILLWIPPVHRAIDRILASSGRLFENGGLRLPLLLGLVGIALFAAFPIATRIYGDSRYIIDDYSAENLAVHLEKMLSFGLLARGRASFVLHDLATRFTGLSFEQTYVVISVLCGGIFLFAHARLAATLPGIGTWARGAILWLGLTDGANQLFFGHVENYTIPRLFGSLFLISVVRSLFEPKPRVRWLPALWFLLAVFFHSQTLVLLPTLLLWLGRGFAERNPALQSWTGGRAVAGGLVAAVVGLGIAYLAFGSWCYDYIYSGGRPHPGQLFLPVTTDCIGLPYLRYTLFSGAHLLDFFGSLYSITSPAILIVLVLLFAPARSDSRLLVLAPSIVTAALHNFVLNPAIGYPFDWDLMCVLSPPLLFTAIFLIARRPSPPKGLAAAIIFFGLATATLFGVNASTPVVRDRIEDMGVWLHRTYFGGSHYRLSANLSTYADLATQARERLRLLERIEPQAYPDDREIGFLWEKLALTNVQRQDYEGALDAYRHALETEPAHWMRKKPLGYLETEVGDLDTGIRILREYTESAPTDGEGWLFLGDGLVRRGDLDGARESWRRFLELAPEMPEAARVREDLRRLEEVEGGGPR
jgi:Flp pilus assembly protein TadD